jgi:hypothetical protein
VLGRYLSPEALYFGSFRLGLALAALVALLLLWRRPRPRVLLVVVLALHVAAWLGYRAPLQRPYGLGEGSDRTFNVGMAASVAVGHSPFEHTQVGHGSPEPLWPALVALLAGRDPGRVPAVFDALTPIALLAVGLATYFAFRRRAAGGEWDAVVIAFAVLSLSSIAIHPRPPVPPFWVANFLYKPNHGIAFALTAAVIALAGDRRRARALAVVLSLLAWVFLLGWAYAAAGLLAALALMRPPDRPWRPVLAALGVSALVALPYVRHLARDYSPAMDSATARHMWNDPNALLLAMPNWSTLDLGALLPAGLAGLWLVRRRRDAFEASVFGFGLAAWGMWALSLPLALAGIAPEPDELHFHLRFVMSLCAGLALSAAARLLSEHLALAEGRGHLLAIGACLPLAFPIAHDPPAMDRYYAESVVPVPPKVVAYADWIRANTPADAVFVAGRSSGMWIPALTGRRVLLAHAGKLLPKDHDARKEAERTLLTGEDEGQVRAAAQRWGVTHLAIDEELMHEYGAEGFMALGNRPWHRTVFANSAARLVELR